MVTKAAAPWRSTAELVEAVLEADDKIHARPVTEGGRALIRAALIEGGVKQSDLDWMTASCPSLRTARRCFPKRTP